MLLVPCFVALAFTFVLSIAGATPEIEVIGEGKGPKRIRASALGSSGLQIEASTNLSAWSLIARTNASALEFLDSDAANFRQRYFRAAADASNASLQFVAPGTAEVVTTNRPLLELAFSGIDVNASNLVIRLLGRNLPLSATITNNRAIYRPLEDLPEGFVTLNAVYLGANLAAGPFARLNLNVRTSTNNAPPRVEPDFASATLGAPVAVRVLQNDDDPNGDSLSVVAFTEGTNGSVRFENGVASYTPRAGFIGLDRFSYTVSDGRGGSNSATVRISVTAAAEIVAYVVDAPLLPNEFLEIGEAVNYLCTAAPGRGRRGRVIIRSERNLSLGLLQISCPLTIDRDDDRRSRIAGSDIRIISESELTLAGMSLSGNNILIDSGADVSLFGLEFGGPVRIRLRDPNVQAAAIRSAATEVGQNLQLVDFRGDAITATLEASRETHVQVADGDSGSFHAEGAMKAASTFEMEALHNDVLDLKLKMEGTAEISADSVVSAGLHEERLEVTGNNRVRLNSVISGKLALDFHEAGRLEASVRNSRLQEWNNILNTSEVTHTGSGNTVHDLSYTVGDASHSLTAWASNDGLRVDGHLSIVNHPRARFSLDLAGARINDKTTVTTRGTLDLTVRDNFDLRAELEAQFEEGDATVNLRNGAMTGMTATVKPGVRLNSTLWDKLQVGGDIKMDVRDGAFITIGGLLNSDFGLGSAVQIRKAQAPGARSVGALAAGAGAGAEFVITNCTFVSGSSAGTPAPITVAGLDIPVRIEKNRIQAAPWGIIVSEVTAPLTIRSNVLINGGISIDGDIEGEGRRGISEAPYHVVGNTIKQGHAPQGISIQDSKASVVERNDISASSGVVVSASHVTLTNNVIDASTNGSFALRTSSGPNGPAEVVVTENTITGAAPLVMLPDTYARFVANRFVSVAPEEDAEPTCVLNIGNGLGIQSVVFERNEFENVTFNALGPTFLRLSDNRGTLSEIGIQALPGLTVRPVGAIIENNQFGGESPQLRVVSGTSLLMRGNTISDFDVTIAGLLAASFAVIEGNAFGGASSVNSILNGYLRLSGNTFGADGTIRDSGFLVNDPGGNGINTEAINSPINFDRDTDNCADYPSPQFTDDPNDPCKNGKGVAIPSAPNIPPPAEPPWPAL